MKKNENKIDQKQDRTKSPSKGNKKTPKWFYIVLILLPIIFILLLEIVLRVLNYGKDYKEFISFSSYHPEKQYLNPELPLKYFYNIKSTPSVIPDGFDINKKPNAFRIFVLGGSSTAGWPYVSNASFPRQLKRRLELVYPNNTIEVINCGISAINTYTIRDLVPGIIKEKPDLILIYAGHNEYYGAFGVASSVSFINSRFLVNTYLWSLQFKTVQFTQNIVTWIYGIFSSISKDTTLGSNETLMSKLAGESLITLNSGLYDAGISQFKGNMDDIIKWFKDAGIPVVIGNLICNLKDIKPFVSVKTENLPAADDIYNQALQELNSGNKKNAVKLFTYAKDLDALKFRAPQKINDEIKFLAEKYNIPFVDLDSAFIANSPDEIIGFNLTVDHLHPNIEGYRLISDQFYRVIKSYNLLPNGKRRNLTDSDADKTLLDNFPFTKLDSTIATMKLIVLTGNYPFVPKGTPNYKMLNFRPKDIVDSIAIDVYNRDIPWEVGHANLADYYFYRGDYGKSIKEINAIIAELPDYKIPYNDAIVRMVANNQLDQAENFLTQRHKIKPDYFSYKWLGQIKLTQHKPEEALGYLNEATTFKEADYQTYYNLAGALYLTGNINDALLSIEKSLKLNPKNSAAINFYKQLKLASKKKPR